jgi:uncharacterized protein YkwD
MNRHAMNRTPAFILTLIFICLSLPAKRADALPASFAGKILEEINLARSQPHRYADYLRHLRNDSEGTAYKVPGSPLPIQTREGTEAVDEAIRFLERQKPLPALSWSAGLAAAAHELSREQSKTGGIGHVGESGGVRERIARQGRWKGRIGENIAYGPGNPRGMVMQLIINDGVPERGHRRNIFRRSFAESGISCAPHPHYGGLCVMDFAGRFLD